VAAGSECATFIWQPKVSMYTLAFILIKATLICRLVYENSFIKRDSDTFDVMVNLVAAGSVLFCELSRA